MSHLGGQIWGGVFGGDVDSMSPEDIQRALEESAGNNANFIRKMAEVVNKMFATSIPTSGNPCDIAAKIIDTLPDGKSRFIDGNDKRQAKALQSLAKGVSIALGKPDLISTSGKPEEIFTNLANVVLAVANGIHLDTTKAYGAFRGLLTRLRALNDLQLLLERSLAEQMDRLDPTTQVAVAPQIESMKSLMPEVSQSIKTTIAALEIQLAGNFEKELTKLDQTNTDIENTIKTIITQNALSEESAKRIGRLVATTGIVTKSAADLHSILKAVKMPVSEFQQLVDKSKTALDLLSGMMEKIPNKNADTLSALTNWQDSLTLIFSDMKSGAHADQWKSELARINDIKGGATRVESAYQRQLRQRTKARLLVAKMFVKGISGKYMDILKHLDFQNNIGIGIPVSEELRNFAHCLNAMQDFRKRSVYPALIGLNTSVQGTQQKAEYIRSIDNLRDAAGRLLAKSEYASIRNSLEGIRGAIDALKSYVENFATNLGKTDALFKGMPAPAVGGGHDDESYDNEAFEGGVYETAYGGAYDIGSDTQAMFDQLREFADINNSSEANKVKETITRFNYYIEMANVELGFKSSSKALADNGERYERLLAEKVAALIDSENKKHNEQMRIVDAFQAEAVSQKQGASPTEGPLLDDFIKHSDEIRKFIAHSSKTRQEFLQLVEAVEHHLRQFVIDISKNPRAISDLKEMLDNTEFNSHWYGESSGDALSSAADHLDKSSSVNLDDQVNGLSPEVKEIVAKLPAPYQTTSTNKMLGLFMAALRHVAGFATNPVTHVNAFDGSGSDPVPIANSVVANSIINMAKSPLIPINPAFINVLDDGRTHPSDNTYMVKAQLDLFSSRDLQRRWEYVINPAKADDPRYSFVASIHAALRWYSVPKNIKKDVSTYGLPANKKAAIESIISGKFPEANNILSLVNGSAAGNFTANAVDFAATTSNAVHTYPAGFNGSDMHNIIAAWNEKVRANMFNGSLIHISMGFSNDDGIHLMKESGLAANSSVLLSSLQKIIDGDAIATVGTSADDAGGVWHSSNGAARMIEELIRYRLLNKTNRFGGTKDVIIDELRQANRTDPAIDPKDDHFLARLFALHQHLVAVRATFLPSLKYIYDILVSAKSFSEIAAISYWCADRRCGTGTGAGAGAGFISTGCGLGISTKQMTLSSLFAFSGITDILPSASGAVTMICNSSNSPRLIESLSNFAVFGFPRGQNFYAAFYNHLAQWMLNNLNTAGKSIDYTNTYKDLLQSYRSNAVLRNLIEAVVSVSAQYGSQQTVKGGAMMMSPQQLYQRLVSYLSLINVKIDIADNARRQGGANVPVPAPSVLEGWNASIKPLVTACKSSADECNRVKALLSVQQNTIDNGQPDPLAQHFVRVIKGMIMKVFTTVGVFDMFNDPIGRTRFTPMRMMIGGNADGGARWKSKGRGGMLEMAELPEVNPELVEVYFRLPLLAELQREIFAFEKGPYFNDAQRPADMKERIVLIPEIDGVYSSFIEFIFNREQFGEEATYSEADVAKIVRMVNDIYAKRRDVIGSNITIGLLQDYINEINRRYGIASEADRNLRREEQLITNRALGSDDVMPEPWEMTNFDSGDIDGYVAPSSAFTSSANINALSVDQYQLDKRNLDTNMPYAMHTFRLWLGQYFAEADKLARDVNSYSSIMDSVRTEFSLARTPQDRFAIVMRLLQGADYLTTLSQVKYVMFHETVVVNLSVLNSYYTMIQHLEDSLKQMDVAALEQKVKDALSKQITPPSGVQAAVTAKPGVGDDNDLLPNRLRYLNSLYISENHGYLYNKLTKSAIAFNGLNLNTLIDAEDVGLCGGLWGISAILYATGADLALSNNGNNVSAAADRANAFAFFAVDRGLIFRDLLATLSDFASASNGIISTEVAGGIPMLMFSKFVDQVNNLMANTRSYLEFFGRVFTEGNTNEIIKQFEDPSRVGSYYWLERELVDKYINGVEYDVNTRSAKTEQYKYSLKMVNTRIDEIFNACLQELSGDQIAIDRKSVLSIYGLEGPGMKFVRASADNTAIKCHDIAGAFSELITFPNAPSNSRLWDNLVASHGANGIIAPGIVTSLNKDAYGANHTMFFDSRSSVSALKGIPRPNNFNSMYFPDKGHFGSIDQQRNNNTVLLLFNDLLSKLIMSSYDYASFKFPPTVVNGLTNTAFNAGGTGRSSVPDVLPNPYQYLMYAVSDIYTSTSSKVQAMQDLSRMGIHTLVAGEIGGRSERLELTAVRPENFGRLISGLVNYSQLYNGRGFKNVLNTPRWLLYNYVFAHAVRPVQASGIVEAAERSNCNADFGRLVDECSLKIGVSLLEGEKSFMEDLFMYIITNYLAVFDGAYLNFAHAVVNYLMYDAVQSAQVTASGGLGVVVKDFVHLAQANSQFKALPGIPATQDLTGIVNLLNNSTLVAGNPVLSSDYAGVGGALGANRLATLPSVEYIQKLIPRAYVLHLMGQFLPEMAANVYNRTSNDLDLGGLNFGFPSVPLDTSVQEFYGISQQSGAFQPQTPCDERVAHLWAGNLLKPGSMSLNTWVPAAAGAGVDPAVQSIRNANHYLRSASGVVLSVVPLVSHLFRRNDGALDAAFWAPAAPAAPIPLNNDPFIADGARSLDAMLAHTVQPGSSFASHVYVASDNNTLARFLLFHIQLCFDVDANTLSLGLRRIGEFNSYVGVRTDQTSGDAGNRFRTMFAPPAPGTVVLSSLSEMIKAITTQKVFGEKGFDQLRFRADNMAAVSQAAQESINVNFPIIEKLFMSLVAKTKFLKSVVSSRKIPSHALIARRPFTGVGIGWIGQNSTTSFIAPEDSLKPSFEATCDTVMSASFQAISIINDTLSEIVAKPEFFETRNNFIQLYQQINQRLPFMPLSQLTAALSVNILNDPSHETQYALWPERNGDQASYQFKHGTRSVLTRYKLPLAMDKMQGVREILTRYNEAAFLKFDESTFNKSIPLTIDALRLAIDFYAYALQQSAASCCNRAYMTKRMHDDAVVANSPNGSKYTFQMHAKQLQEVVALTNDSNSIEQVAKVVKHVMPGLDVNKDTRRTMRIKNIVDANLVPFNLNALEREVPGIYLYNYAYAFDRTMLELLNVNPNNFVDLLTYGPLQSLDDPKFTDYAPNDIFAALLIHPYTHVGQQVYYNQVARIVRGDTGMELGRPKMISDQLFPKVLFYSMYLNKGNKDYAPHDQRFGRNLSDRTFDRPRQLTNMRNKRANENFKNADTLEDEYDLVDAPGQSLEAGRNRFNSLYLVRDIMFLVQVQRVLIFKLGKELEKHHELMISSYQLLDSSITEFSGNQTWTKEYVNKMSPYDLTGRRNNISYPKVAQPPQ